MIEKNTLVEVTNRDNGRVGYTIPDMNNLYRVFMPGEKKLKKYKDKKNKITLSRMRLYFFIIFSPKFRKIKL